MKNNSVAVLLATYNGGRYLAEQLDSILNQQNVSTHLIIRDDGSIDNTVEIINEYCTLYPNQITLVKKAATERGYIANFSALCEYAINTPYNYFCFADQDDVWLPNKLELTLNKMLNESPSLPQLVHSDLMVVDNELQEIAPSFFNFQGLPNPTKHCFPEFCHQNVVTGCACVFNRALLQVAAPNAKQAVVHDFWFAQCARLYGKIFYVDKALVKYRQHGENSIGAVSGQVRTSYFNKYIYQFALSYPKKVLGYVRQAATLLTIEKQAVSCEELEWVTKFASVVKLPLFSRLKLVKSYYPKQKTVLMRVYLYTVFALLPLLERFK